MQKRKRNMLSGRTPTTKFPAEVTDEDQMWAALTHCGALFLMDEFDHRFAAHDAEPRARILLMVVCKVRGLDTAFGHAIQMVALERCAPAMLDQMKTELTEDAALENRKDFCLPTMVDLFFNSRDDIDTFLPPVSATKLLDTFSMVETIIGDDLASGTSESIDDALAAMVIVLQLFIRWRLARQTGPVPRRLTLVRPSASAPSTTAATAGSARRGRASSAPRRTSTGKAPASSTKRTRRPKRKGRR